MKLLLQRVSSNESVAGILLIVTSVVAIVLANFSATQELYFTLLNTTIEIRIGALSINKNISMWINEALMSVFFLLIGIEVKRELIQGSLASYKQATLPVIAACGGMISPALIYLVFNHRDPVVRVGWAIPVATDIAFAVGILSLLGKSIPKALKTFLKTLAVVDDLGSIIIITLFYTKHLSIVFLSLTIVLTIILIFLSMSNIPHTSVYVLIGTILWIVVLKAGIHATLAGVILGFIIPLKGKEGGEQQENGKVTSPARNLEHALYPWVVFMILPLFALTNAGICFQGITRLISNIATSSELTLLIGVVIGLLIGKPLGISLFCWLALKFKIALLPKEITFCHIMAISVLCGIGFTMSIFIANLAFAVGTMNSLLIKSAKLGILTSSLLASVIGYVLLRIKFSAKDYKWFQYLNKKQI